MRTVKLFVLAGVLVVLVIAVMLATPYLQRMQQEREWRVLQDGCVAERSMICVQLVTQVTPACTRDRDAVACYHLARVLAKGVTHPQDSGRVASYYQLACRAGVRRACTRSNP